MRQAVVQDSMLEGSTKSPVVRWHGGKRVEGLRSGSSYLVHMLRLIGSPGWEPHGDRLRRRAAFRALPAR